MKNFLRGLDCQKGVKRCNEWHGGKRMPKSEGISLLLHLCAMFTVLQLTFGTRYAYKVSYAPVSSPPPSLFEPDQDCQLFIT